MYVTKPHQMLADGRWECPAVGKVHGERTVKMRGGQEILACGHCVHTVVDAKGEIVPWTMRDQFAWRKACSLSDGEKTGDQKL